MVTPIIGGWGLPRDLWASQAVCKLSREDLSDSLEMSSRDRKEAKMPGICCLCTFQAISFGFRHLKASIKNENVIWEE